jgi:iron-only hydrogenase group A
MVVAMAPAVRVAIGEEMGLGAGTATVGRLVGALRQLGFDRVLDVDFSADLTIMEEGTELLQRLKAACGLADDSAATVEAASAKDNSHPGPLPMFTSCCPAWVSLVEKSHPALLPHLSTAKSPQGMLGAVVKRHYSKVLGVKSEDVCLVSVMPCTAKKSEADRTELRREGEARDVDHVLTTRELGHLFRLRQVALGSQEESPFDSHMGASTGAAVLFGTTGGVMEAALRSVYELASGRAMPKLEVEDIRGLAGIKASTVVLPSESPPGLAGREIRVAVASGIANAQRLLAAMEAGTEPKYDFIEVMACPGGCIGGGGQPKTLDPLVLIKRQQAVYSLDERATVRKSHENAEVGALYRDSLGAPGGALAHELLHTRYTDRSGNLHI